MSQPVFHGPLTEFVERDLGQEAFLIDDLLAVGGTGITYASRNHGKTALSLTLARDVLRGTPFLDHFRTRQGSVAFLLVDKPLLATQKRFRQYAGALANLEDVFVVAKQKPIDVMDLAAEDEQALKRIEDFDPDLLIIDTLRKIHNLPENESQTVRTILDWRYDQFGEKTAVMFNHHTVKETFFTKERDEEAMLRGSTAWLDDLELGLYLKKREKNGEEIFHVGFPRLSYRQPIPAITCDFDREHTTLSPQEPEDMNAQDWADRFLVGKPDASKSELRDFLQNEAGDGGYDDGYIRELTNKMEKAGRI